jgi:hypothetical protein
VTVATRRRIVLCVVAMVLTLPIETILLKAISNPTSREGARAWVNSLSADALLAAADEVESYPTLYRKEILRAVSNDIRARVWTHHIKAYRNRPGLSQAVENLLDEALALITPEFFSAPTSDERARARQIGEELSALIGRDEAEFVLYRLGPRDGTFASAEPLGERAVNWVRRMVTAFASAEDCDCSSDWGCGSMSTCRTGTSCSPDSSWPACGWLWTETCDGLCGSASSN